MLVTVVMIVVIVVTVVLVVEVNFWCLVVWKLVFIDDGRGGVGGGDEDLCLPQNTRNRRGKRLHADESKRNTGRDTKLRRRRGRKGGRSHGDEFKENTGRIKRYKKEEEREKETNIIIDTRILTRRGFNGAEDRTRDRLEGKHTP